MFVRALNWRRVSRSGLILATGMLAAVLLVRAVVALVEALAVLLLAASVASLTLPHGLGWYWRRVRTEVSGWLERLARFMDSRPEPSSETEPATAQPTTKGKEE